jgi:hypothetical protein
MDDWLKQAACRGMDLRVFFPAGEAGVPTVLGER